MESDIEKCAARFDSAVVVNETQLPGLIQKETHTRARGADHVGQCVLADLRNDRLRLAFFPIVGQQRRLTVANFGKIGLRIERCSLRSGRWPSDFLARKESDDNACFSSQCRSPFVHTCFKFSTRSLLVRSATLFRRMPVGPKCWDPGHQVTSLACSMSNLIATAQFGMEEACRAKQPLREGP